MALLFTTYSSPSILALSGFSCRCRETSRGRNGISIYEMERNLRAAVSLSLSFPLPSECQNLASALLDTAGEDGTETDTTLLDTVQVGNAHKIHKNT